MKNSKNAVFTRDFVDWIRTDPKALQLLAWLEFQSDPLDYYFGTLAFSTLKWKKSVLREDAGSILGIQEGKEDEL